MASYIGKVQIGTGDPVLVGSTLYGVCETAAATAAKVVTLNDFNALVNGITVHVRFTNGNSVTASPTLQVGTTTAQNVIGNFVCNADDVVAFTYWEEEVNSTLTKTWYVNSNVVVAEGTTDGTIKVNGQTATVHGLGSAAYTSSGAYATAAQGTLADNAMPISGGTFTGAISGPEVSDSSASGTLATVDYVRTKTAGLSGLTGAMHFKGSVAAVPPSSGTYESGDVILGPNDKEYVYDGTNWIELGDEGSYVLQDSQTSGSVGSASGWNAGSASQASVTNGVLQLTNSVAPSLTVTSTNVIVPVVNTP